MFREITVEIPNNVHVDNSVFVIYLFLLNFRLPE